jgi:hypothetical protein
MQGQKPFFIEFRLENRLMIEVLSPAMARDYEDFLKNAQLFADERSRIAAIEAGDAHRCGRRT